MRRGLMAWDADEIPVDALKERTRRLQSAVAAAGHDAMILYANFIRSAAVSHLTAFSPYWADGVLLVPVKGEPVFATTLSKRVGSWIETVKPVGGLVNSPTPGAVLGKRLAAGGNVRRVAILELDAFPSGLYDELSAALPGAEFVDGSDVFAIARGTLDAVEQRLLERADAIAQAALDGLNTDAAADVGAAVGAVEKQARLQGAEEVYIAIAPDLDSDRRFLRLSGAKPLGRRFAIRATVAYKGSWIRCVQTYARDEKDRLPIRRADAWFETFAASIKSVRPLDKQITVGIASLPGAQLSRWIAEGTVGTRPLAVVASSNGRGEMLRRVPALVLTLELTIDGVPWCAAGLGGFDKRQSA
jgi:hypothetical protein